MSSGDRLRSGPLVVGAAREVLVDGKPLDDARYYTVTACVCEGDKADTLCRIPIARNPKVTEFDAHEAVPRYLAKHPEATAALEGRAVGEDFEDVVWLSWGRAVVALDPTVSAIPADIRTQAEEAQKAGVRLVACGQALRKWGIDPATLSPKAEVVPNGVDELARLVSLGYQVIRY